MEHKHEHKHEHGPDCCCGATNVMTIEFDDDTSIECEILGTFEAGDKEYIALLKQDESEEILIYGFIEHEDDVELINIEDEEEFQKASEVLDQLLDEELDDDLDEELEDESDEDF
ncbi:MAG: DUF1292 domain-containing protein [Methanimicrococcus sp.]|nr:DUF1292 domain-containing protein [Methanimicrococcus sp.]